MAPTPCRLSSLYLLWSCDQIRMVAGIEGWTRMTWGTRATPAIGAISRTKLKLRFSYIVALIVGVASTIKSVWPSGAARTTDSAPFPPAPGRFSTTNGWPGPLQ